MATPLLDKIDLRKAAAYNPSMGLIKAFLAEDIGEGDVTTEAIVAAEHRSRAIILAKAEGVIAGHPFAEEVFRTLDNEIDYQVLKKDGEWVSKGDLVARIKGRTRALLTGERVALNILQRLSGIATLTRRFVEAVQGTGTKILDTRKTAPGLRWMEKYAVRVGGGQNHRSTLSEMPLIKENHIAVAGSITEAIKRVRALTSLPIEVEVRDMAELQEALAAGADRVMLDNWELAAIKEAVAMVARRVPIEASGNMTLERVREVALTGVDYISVGALTHSYKSLDMSMLQEGTGLLT